MWMVSIVSKDGVCKLTNWVQTAKTIL
jgi:hypothetical protein